MATCVGEGSLYFVICFIDEAGFAEGLESFFEVSAGGGDRIVWLENGFDFGVVALEVVDFIEVNECSLPHIELLAAARDFGDRFEAELEDDIDEFFVILNGGFLYDVNTGVLDVAPKDKIVLSGFVDSSHFCAHDELREIRFRLVIFRHIDTVVLPIDGAEIKLDVGEFLLEIRVIR